MEESESSIVPPKERVNHTPAARESWVRGYESGNSLIPQSSTPGIALLTLDAVLQDPPTTWQEFSFSRLTKNQRERIGQTLSNKHHNRDVPIATADHAKEGDEIVEDEQIDGIWESAKGFADNAIGRYINSIGQHSTAEDADEITVSSQLSQEINAFMTNPANGDAIAHLKEIIATAGNIIRSPGTSALIGEYQEEVLTAFREQRAYYAYPKGEDEQSQPTAFARINQRIMQQLRDTYPDENLSWLDNAVETQ